MEDSVDILVAPTPVEYVVRESCIKPFDASMKSDVQRILNGDDARKWLGEPLSDDTLDIVGRGLYGFRAFGVVNSEKTVGFIYFSPAPFDEMSSQLHGVNPDTTRAVTVTFVKDADAPRGIMSSALLEASDVVMSGKKDVSVSAFVAEDNVASRKFLEKNGFVDVGLSSVEDHEKDRVYVRKN